MRPFIVRVSRKGYSLVFVVFLAISGIKLLFTFMVDLERNPRFKRGFIQHTSFNTYLIQLLIGDFGILRTPYGNGDYSATYKFQ
jgi:hypothetical protein